MATDAGAESSTFLLGSYFAVRQQRVVIYITLEGRGFFHLHVLVLVHQFDDAPNSTASVLLVS